MFVLNQNLSSLKKQYKQVIKNKSTKVSFIQNFRSLVCLKVKTERFFFLGWLQQQSLKFIAETQRTQTRLVCIDVFVWGQYTHMYANANNEITLRRTLHCKHLTLRPAVLADEVSFWQLTSYSHITNCLCRNMHCAK